MSDLFVGESIAVREIRKRNGGLIYGVYRPDDKRMVLDIFDTLEEANFIAQYVEMQGGSYEAKVRKSAKREFKNYRERVI